MAPDRLPSLIQAGTRVLVCGGGGFIASHLLPLLEERRADLRIQELPDYAARLERFPQSAILPGSLLDPDVQEAIRAFDPEVVFNLSGYTDQSHSRDNDDRQEREHFAAARGLARAVFPEPGATSLRRWVQTGSNEEYGHNPIPHREDQAPAPVSAYSVAKAAATLYVRMLHQSQGCPVVVVRPFVVYGPGQSRGLVPFAVRAALEDRAFDTTEGTQCRDFVYVEDIARGFLAAGDTPGVDGEIFNLGSGVETPIRELLKTCCRLAGGGRPNFGAIPLREGEILRMQADITKAGRLLGWQPEVSLEEGLQRMIEAFRSAPAASS